MNTPDLSLSLCNEMLADEGFTLAQQCQIARALGYQGLELSMGTFSPEPHLLGGEEIASIRQTIENEGLRVTGLHWLLAPYPHASILDPEHREGTNAILGALIHQCAVLGGSVLVHGSPGARQLPDGMSQREAVERASQFFAPLARQAQERGVAYCFEPLSPNETSFITSVGEASELVDAIDNPAFVTMIDTSATGQLANVSVAQTIRQWVPTGIIGHVQVNDSNRGAPGTGSDPFGQIVEALQHVGWDRPIAVEPFKATINATTTAAIGAATMRAHWQASALRQVA